MSLKMATADGKRRPLTNRGVLQAHALIAQQVVDLIAKTVAGWNNPNPITVDNSQVGTAPTSSWRSPDSPCLSNPGAISSLPVTWHLEHNAESMTSCLVNHS